MKKFLTIIMALAITASAASLAAGGTAFPEDYTTFRHIGSLIIPDKTSPLFGIHHFYMNEPGKQAFEKGRTLPESTEIVGAVYEAMISPEGIINEGKKEFYTYMKKDALAEDTGGWQFAAFAPDGRQLEMDVKNGCFACHLAAKDSDYVFSKPLK